MLLDANYSQLKQLNHENEMIFTLVYTSMCGTCESAKIMLNVVSEAVNEIQYLKINANLNPEIIKDYDITSIPCFMMFKDGKLVEQFYAFHSVTYLFDKVKQLINAK